MRERRRDVGRWVLLAGLFAPFSPGCSVLSGFGVLPERQELIPDADRLRRASGTGFPANSTRCRSESMSSVRATGCSSSPSTWDPRPAPERPDGAAGRDH